MFNMRTGRQGLRAPLRYTFLANRWPVTQAAAIWRTAPSFLERMAPPFGSPLCGSYKSLLYICSKRHAPILSHAGMVFSTRSALNPPSPAFLGATEIFEGSRAHGKYAARSVDEATWHPRPRPCETTILCGIYVCIVHYGPCIIKREGSVCHPWKARSSQWHGSPKRKREE